MGMQLTHNPVHSQTELLNREKRQRQNERRRWCGSGPQVPGTSSEAPSPSGSRSLVQGGTLGMEQSVNIGDLQFLCSAFVVQRDLSPQRSLFKEWWRGLFACLVYYKSQNISNDPDTRVGNF